MITCMVKSLETPSRSGLWPSKMAQPTKASGDKDYRRRRCYLVHLELFQVFSIKYEFSLDGPDGFTHCWRNFKRDSQYFRYQNFDGGSLMVWACFGQMGKTKLAFPSSKVDSAEIWGILMKLTDVFYSTISMYSFFSRPTRLSMSVSNWFKTYPRRSVFHQCSWTDDRLSVMQLPLCC